LPQPKPLHSPNTPLPATTNAVVEHATLIIRGIFASAPSHAFHYP
jgi:hypothetical protein